MRQEYVKFLEELILKRRSEEEVDYLIIEESFRGWSAIELINEIKKIEGKNETKRVWKLIVIANNDEEDLEALKFRLNCFGVVRRGLSYEDLVEIFKTS